MRECGKILNRILSELKNTVKPGVTTKKLDLLAEKLMAQFGVKSSFKNYQGYPASICANINEEVVHGIPSEKKFLKEGDIISIDCGVCLNGYHTDAAITVGVGEISDDAKKFIETAYKALDSAIKIAKPGNKIGDISSVIQNLTESNDYAVVHEFTGHGIGKALHEPPEIPNFGKSGRGFALIPGMTIAIEPIIAMGKRYIKTLPDKWTTITCDKSLACQVEDTILVTDNDCENLTKVQQIS